MTIGDIIAALPFLFWSALLGVHAIGQRRRIEKAREQFMRSLKL
jgi:hypothetical protein